MYYYRNGKKVREQPNKITASKENYVRSTDHKKKKSFSYMRWILIVCLIIAILLAIRLIYLLYKKNEESSE